MKNIHAKQNNFQKRNLTELPITIVTDDEHKSGDNLELTRQRIERAAMYLMSIFNLLKVCAINFEGESESKEMSGFFEDINNHCEIGYGIADSIMASASCLTEFIPDGKAESNIEIKPTDAPNFDGFFAEKYKQTGERVERVLASETVSKEVKNILEALVNEAANEAGFSFPEPDEIALKLPKIFEALGKSKDSFVVYFNAIETTLNHGTTEKDL
jgi:hypothetical protein